MSSPEKWRVGGPINLVMFSIRLPEDEAYVYRLCQLFYSHCPSHAFPRSRWPRSLLCCGHHRPDDLRAAGDRSIQVGDRVLSQGTTTGQLAFQAVIATHRTPSNPTLRIAVGDETIVATGIHRFWKAGKGWTMARELTAGDRLRVINGTIDIRSIEADKVQPVYNLDVAENRDFFVGATELLVHDFTFVQTVLEPFDQTPELGSPVPSPK